MVVIGSSEYVWSDGDHRLILRSWGVPYDPDTALKPLEATVALQDTASLSAEIQSRALELAAFFRVEVVIAVPITDFFNRSAVFEHADSDVVIPDTRFVGVDAGITGRSLVAAITKNT
ncbi:unnamed protein product, partial [Ectocarpus sp. 4 AP-2014]